MAGALVAQEFGSTPTAYPEGSFPQTETPLQEDSPSDKRGLIVVAIGAALLLIIGYFVFFSSSDDSGLEESYPDGTCDLTENCLDHPDDCSCEEGYECSPDGDGADSRGCVSADETSSGDSSQGNAGGTGDTQNLLPEYGNGICEAGENCWDNPKDCKCTEGEYCSGETKVCVGPECGDGNCEDSESPETCCLDCDCLSPALFCNETTRACQGYAMNVSCERALELVEAFYDGQGHVLGFLECMSVLMKDGELMWLVKVNVEGESVEDMMVYRQAGVMSDESVFELESYS